MNSTRRKIIELIEPYMDKTLSEGCLIYRNSVAEFENIIHCYGEENELGGVQIGSDYFVDVPCHINEILGDDFKNEYEIIGHYDITAVLKYIKAKEYRYKDIEEDDFDIDLIGVYRSNMIDKKGEILNKPLHLYSEEEEQNLLDLLQTL